MQGPGAVQRLHLPQQPRLGADRPRLLDRQARGYTHAAVVALCFASTRALHFAHLTHSASAEQMISSRQAMGRRVALLHVQVRRTFRMSHRTIQVAFA